METPRKSETASLPAVLGVDPSPMIFQTCRLMVSLNFGINSFNSQFKLQKLKRGQFSGKYITVKSIFKKMKEQRICCNGGFLVVKAPHCPPRSGRRPDRLDLLSAIVMLSKLSLLVYQNLQKMESPKKFGLFQSTTFFIQMRTEKHRLHCPRCNRGGHF